MEPREPLQEILETVRAMRETQLQARQTQLRAMKRFRVISIVIVVALAAYLFCSWFLLAHPR